MKMDKKWVESEKCRLLDIAQEKQRNIISQINSAEFLTAKDKEDLINLLDSTSRKSHYDPFGTYSLSKLLDNHNKDDDFDFGSAYDFIEHICNDEYFSLIFRINHILDRYIDSDEVEFDGDIIITDPCYVAKDEDSDWDKCCCGENLDKIGITHFMTRDTLYGDWGCTVYNSDTKQKIGEFCADAGMVSVMLLDDVLKYNPDFNYHTERTWTTTLIQDFHGKVQFVVERTEGVYDEDSKWHKAGDKWEDFSVHVVGHGVNKKTGEKINFRSSQTSL
jgi:hypothetical protein